MPQQHHRIDYIEFTVRDLAEAKSFFAEAFGWTFTDYGPDYAGIQRDGGGEDRSLVATTTTGDLNPPTPQTAGRNAPGENHQLQEPNGPRRP